MIVRSLLCTTALMIAAPALAQDMASPQSMPPAATEVLATAAPAPETATPAPESSTAPAPATTPDATPAPADTATTVPADAPPQGSATPAPAQSAATAPAAAAPTEPAPAQSAQAAQPATAAQIAGIVDSEFPTYDADKSGDLSETEFAAWIGALKKQEADATGKPVDPAAVGAYAKGAFASADKDQSKVVTKAELTTFLGG